jgi:hypothetical protein
MKIEICKETKLATIIISIAAIIGLVILGCVYMYDDYVLTALKTGHHEAQQIGHEGTIWVEDATKPTNQ